MGAAYASLFKKGPRLGLFNPGIIAKAIKWLNYSLLCRAYPPLLKPKTPSTPIFDLFIAKAINAFLGVNVVKAPPFSNGGDRENWGGKRAPPLKKGWLL
jgi:hypothetical protein